MHEFQPTLRPEERSDLAPHNDSSALLLVSTHAPPRRAERRDQVHEGGGRRGGVSTHAPPRRAERLDPTASAGCVVGFNPRSAPKSGATEREAWTPRGADVSTHAPPRRAERRWLPRVVHSLSTVSTHAPPRRAERPTYTGRVLVPVCFNPRSAPKSGATPAVRAAAEAFMFQPTLRPEERSDERGRPTLVLHGVSTHAPPRRAERHWTLPCPSIFERFQPTLRPEERSDVDAVADVHGAVVSTHAPPRRAERPGQPMCFPFPSLFQPTLRPEERSDLFGGQVQAFLLVSTHAPPRRAERLTATTTVNGNSEAFQPTLRPEERSDIPERLRGTTV